VPWADARSSSVRPVITYWLMALYCSAKTASFALALNAGADWSMATSHAWTEADQALWAGVLNFWFLGRVFDRVTELDGVPDGYRLPAGGEPGRVRAAAEWR